MVEGISVVTVIGLILTIVVYFLKRKDAGKTPERKWNEDLQTMDEAIVHGDADVVNELHSELFKQDEGYRNSGHDDDAKNGNRRMEGPVGRD